MKGLAVVILDALDIDLIRGFDMDYAHELYMENGDLLTCSTYPYTMPSNVMIWSGQHVNRFWVINKSYGWVDPAHHMDRENDFKGAFTEDDDIEVITYEQLRDEMDGPFIWQLCEEHGLKARALQLPIVLPPYSFNAPEETPAWFPYWEEGIERNRRDKHRLTMTALEEIADGQLDFYCTSFCSPDKALHAPAEGHAAPDFPEREIPKLDQVIRDIDRFCRDNDIGYAILGDHGAPGKAEGSHFARIYDQRIAAVRHGKQSVILGNMDDYPSYTGELFTWMKKKLGM